MVGSSNIFVIPGYMFNGIFCARILASIVLLKWCFSSKTTTGTNFMQPSNSFSGNILPFDSDFWNWMVFDKSLSSNQLRDLKTMVKQATFLVSFLNFLSWDFVNCWMTCYTSRNAQCKGINMRTIEILQCVPILKINYCLNVYNALYKLAPPNSGCILVKFLR